MKLKGFDIYNFSEKFDSEIVEKISEELKPYIIAVKSDIGICFIEDKEKVVKIIKKYETDIHMLGQFKNLSSFFEKNEYADWDNIFLDDIILDGNEVWNEFSKILEAEEKALLNSIGKDFDKEWNRLQKLAIRNVLTKEETRMKKEFNKIISNAEKSFKNLKGIYQY